MFNICKNQATRGLGLAAAAALSMSLIACASPAGDNGDDGQELDSIVVRASKLINGYHAPLFMAQSLGYFEDAGLNVDIRESTGGAANVKLVGNGQIDIALADIPTAAKGIIEGVPITVVAAVFQGTPLATLYLSDSGISKPEDLAGRTIGEQPESATSQYLPAFLGSVGLSMDDVRTINIDPGARDRLLLSGDIDAFNSYAVENLPILQVNSPDANVEAFWWKDSDLQMLGEGFIVNNDYLAENQDALTRFMEAYARGYVAASEDPDAAVEAIQSYYPNAAGGSAEALRLQWAMSSALQHTPLSEGHPLLYMTEESWDATFDVLAEYAGVTTDLPASEFYTNDLIADIEKPEPVSE